MAEMIVCDGCGAKSYSKLRRPDWLVVEVRTGVGKVRIAGDFHSWSCLEVAVRVANEDAKAGDE